MIKKALKTDRSSCAQSERKNERRLAQLLWASDSLFVIPKNISIATYSDRFAAIEFLICFLLFIATATFSLAGVKVEVMLFF